MQVVLNYREHVREQYWSEGSQVDGYTKEFQQANQTLFNATIERTQVRNSVPFILAYFFAISEYRQNSDTPNVTLPLRNRIENRSTTGNTDGIIHCRSFETD